MSRVNNGLGRAFQRGCQTGATCSGALNGRRAGDKTVQLFVLMSGRLRNRDPNKLAMAVVACHDLGHLSVARSDPSYILVSIADCVKAKQVRFPVPLSPPPEDVMNDEGSRTSRRRFVTTLDQPNEKFKCGPGSSWDKEHLLDLDVDFHPRRVVSFDTVLWFPPDEWTQEIRDRMCLGSESLW